MCWLDLCKFVFPSPASKPSLLLEFFLSLADFLRLQLPMLLNLQALSFPSHSGSLNSLAHLSEKYSSPEEKSTPHVKGSAFLVLCFCFQSLSVTWLSFHWLLSLCQHICSGLPLDLFFFPCLNCCCSWWPFYVEPPLFFQAGIPHSLNFLPHHRGQCQVRPPGSKWNWITLSLFSLFTLFNPAVAFDINWLPFLKFLVII